VRRSTPAAGTRLGERRGLGGLRALGALGALGACALLVASAAWAQPPGRGAALTHPMSAQQAAPVDLTGYWGSIITQDWLYRVVVNQRGNYVGIPINVHAREVADAWNRSTDEAAGKQCEAYGAPAILRLPEHLHISWLDPQTLQVQIDAGMQTRLLRFAPTPGQMHGPPSLQGISVAQWMPYQEGPGFVGAATRRGMRAHYGWLQVTTTDMQPGLLRKNGVPYSGETHMSENWAVNADPEGDRWLVVTTTLDDPTYLQVPYILEDIFQKQPDATQWDPSPCSLSH